MIRVLHIGDRLRRVGEVAQNVETSFVSDEPGFVQIETIFKRYASQLLSERNDTHFEALHRAVFGDLRRSDGILATVFLYGGIKQNTGRHSAKASLQMTAPNTAAWETLLPAFRDPFDHHQEQLRHFRRLLGGGRKRHDLGSELRRID